VIPPGCIFGAMSTPVRLTAFAVLLALVFGGAALAGDAIGPDGSDRDPAPAPAAHGAGHGQDEHAAAGPAAGPTRGLGVSEGGLTLALDTPALAPGRPGELRFGIEDARGARVTAFDVEHERRMHVIVVRRDGRGFQHVHPEMAADGTWRVAVTLGEPGAYRVFADFARDGAARTLAADLTADGDARYAATPAPRAQAPAGDGYAVRLDAGGVRAGRERELRFTVTKGGRTVHPEPYLGAGGHLVALREGDLAYLHVHPAGHGEGREDGGHDDAVAFATTFPTAGTYRLYLQFRHGGRVRTAAFTQEVAR
jgi:hypothetical protein